MAIKESSSGQEMKERQNRFSYLLPVSQILFYIVISITTIWSLQITCKQTDLMFQPTIGIVNVVTTRIHVPSSVEETYENLAGVRINFVIENAGTGAAKDLHIKVTGKIGKTTLPYTETEAQLSEQGVVLLPKAQYNNRTTIDKQIIERMAEANEKLIYTVRFDYSDWEGYKTYSYTTRFLILYIKPLEFAPAVLPPS